MPSSDGEECSPLQSLLSQLNIEPCFHSLISSACSHKENYVKDIEPQDLEGKLDANADVVPAAVARGLVRKLRRRATGAPSTPTPSKSIDAKQSATLNSPVGHVLNTSFGAAAKLDPCSVSLRRGAGDYRNFLRCSIRGKFPESGSASGKVLTAILDNSGSMRPQWELVVDAIARVFTDRLLQDDGVSLILVVYNSNALEVKLPRTAIELSDLLRTKYAPEGLTNFERAFEIAQRCIRREVDLLRGRGLPIHTIDVTTLLFTDGQDTSVPPLGYTSQAATNKARKSGDRFQEFLSSLQCRSHFTSIAAFGEYHDPGQCQYLSDRYYYINRPEVLSDWLSGGLAEMLESSGFCSICAVLPPNLRLVEPLPKTVSLESGGCVGYEIWLSAEETDSGSIALPSSCEVAVTVEDGKTTLRGLAVLSSAATIDPNSLEGRIFLLDWGEVQLRQIALSLAGGRPSTTKLAMLRERLAGVKVLSQPIADVANDPRARLSGRAVLLARLEELELKRNRLSYALGHYEEEEHGDVRKMGSVGIDAVLRDASQRSVANTTVKELRRAEAAANLMPPEELSEYGKQSACDNFSGCDAARVAEQGDALFFPVGSPAYQSESPISFDVFAILSNNGQRGVKDAGGQIFSRIGIPIFASPGHFARAKLVLRDVLERLSPDGTYTKGSSELLLVDLLGEYLQQHLRQTPREALPNARIRSDGLFHRARSVAAVLASTIVDSFGRTLLEVTEEEAMFFLDHPEKRESVKDLYRTMALGLMLADSWSIERFRDFGEAVLDETIRRAISRSLSGLSDLEKLKLAWSMLGPPRDGYPWLDCPIQYHTNGSLPLESICFQTAASDLKILEEQSPGTYSPRTPSLVVWVLTSKPPSGTPPIDEWGALGSLVVTWNAALEQAHWKHGGLWKMLDRLMTQEMPEVFLDRPYWEPAKTALRNVLPGDRGQILPRIIRSCINGMDGDSSDLDDQPLRFALASKISSLVEEKANYARAHPIQGAAYPTKRGVSSKEMQLWWGSAAQPVDEQLYREVRRSVHGRNPRATLIAKEALADKAYHKQGGHFAFPSELDTFIPGLHRRTRDLHDAWLQKHKPTRGADARKAAVEEMLLRLRWDRRDDRARAKLSKIVAQIWDGLEGVAPGRPLHSALWMDDEDEEKGHLDEGKAKDGASVPDFVFTMAASSKQGMARDNESVNTDWSVL